MTARSTLRRIVVWGPLASYLGLIFYLSSRSTTGWTGPYPDKLLHFLEYGGLAVLMARALNGGIRTPIPAGRLALAGLLALVYALTDEIHQAFVPERVSDWRDFAADALGAATALLLLGLAGRLIGRRVATAETRTARPPRPLPPLAPKEPT